MRRVYPSDISREQFEVIRHYLEGARKVTHPRSIDLYDIFCAVLYILREGCRWRSLPHDYPTWQNCYKHYRIWANKGSDGKSIIDQVLEDLVMSERIIKGRNPKPTMSIADSKSVKNIFTAEEKGYDGGKKVSGIKIHVGVDILGLPHAISATTADVTDRMGAIQMYEHFAPNLASIIKVLCDGGYTGQTFADAIMKLLKAEVEIAKRNELHTFAVIPKRWIVERTFAWLEHFRRLWKNCERLLHNTLQMTTLAFVALLLKRW
jgi:transposase